MQKANIFIKKKISTPPAANLKDIIEYIYPIKISHNENLTEKEIATTIRRLKIYKTSGSNTLKNYYIDNISIPRMHSVIIIFRKSDKNNYIKLKVYRFIVLLNILNKTLESVIIKRFNNIIK